MPALPGVRLRTHVDHCVSKLAKIRQRLPFEGRWEGFLLFENSLRPPVTKLPHPLESAALSRRTPKADIGRASFRLPLKPAELEPLHRAAGRPMIMSTAFY